MHLAFNEDLYRPRVIISKNLCLWPSVIYFLSIGVREVHEGPLRSSHPGIATKDSNSVTVDLTSPLGGAASSMYHFS